MTTRVTPLLCLLVMVMALPASAAPRGDRQQQQLRRLQQLNRQLSVEKGQLEKDKSALENDLKSKTEELDRTQSTAQSTRSELNMLQASKRAVDHKNAELEAQLSETANRLRDTEARLRDRDAELKRLAARGDEQRQIIGRQSQAMLDCRDKNGKLADINLDLMQRYRSKSVGDALQEVEPFTGMKQVEVFNLIQEYRDKTDALRLESTAPKGR